MGYFGQLVN